MSERYVGKPLLRLVEFFVLDAIGALSAADEKQLDQQSAQIAGALGADGATWQTAISQALDLPSDFPYVIRSDWQATQASGAETGTPPTAEAFAATIADSFVS